MAEDTNWTVGQPVRSPESHVAQFYDSEDFVCEMAAKFLLEGARNDQPLVMLVTPAHREAITAILRTKGIDPAALVSIDAQEIMSEIMIGDMPDEQRFRRSIGAILTAAAGSRRIPLRVYGEIADLLMSSGRWEASLRLEEFWNNIADTHQFSILCAHSLENFYEDTAAALLHEVCRRHGSANPAA